MEKVITFQHCSENRRGEETILHQENNFINAARLVMTNSGTGIWNLETKVESTACFWTMSIWYQHERRLTKV